MKAYRCGHSGKLLPMDYVENWGILYGHGLGSVPVSECLDTIDRSVPDFEHINYAGNPEHFMLPFCHSKAPIELVDVDEKEYNNGSNRLIMHIDDPDLSRRTAILRRKQKNKPEFKKMKAYHQMERGNEVRKPFA